MEDGRSGWLTMTRLAGLATMLVFVASSGAGAGVTKARPLKTGQATSYGAIGDTIKGVARSYVDLETGVIKDRKTGLFWEKKSDDGSIHDADNLYPWTTGASSQADGAAFTVFLATLNTPPCLGGFCDWRLPTISELLTLFDFGRRFPSIDPLFHDGCTAGCSARTCSCTRNSTYWSSSTVQTNESQAWLVDFSGSGPAIVNYGKLPFGGGHHVRAVRGGTP